jgi:hypothetical protein
MRTIAGVITLEKNSQKSAPTVVTHWLDPENEGQMSEDSELKTAEDYWDEVD